ncbi:MAG TPA: hypothetical protein VHC49_11315 [Mycobacteriales bacterium]|nr:hypothetical protein [Mycobacteriales bacterium]
MPNLIDRPSCAALGDGARLRVVAQLSQLYSDLHSIFHRDPEQELTGVALSVADHLFATAGRIIRSATAFPTEVPELISPEALEAGEPVRAVDAMVATGQILAAIGSTPIATN